MDWPVLISQAHVVLTLATVLDLCDKQSFIQLCCFLYQCAMCEIHK